MYYDGVDSNRPLAAGKPLQVVTVNRAKPGIAWWSNQGEIASFQRSYYDGLDKT